ncbi:MAG: pseudaminic acid synthase [Puniceicoccaceae bacterium]
MIIAELSANHAQDERRAHQWIDAAAEAGADAIKVQTYTPDTLTFCSNQPPFVIEDQALWSGRSLWDLYEEAHTPWQWQPELKAHAEERGLQFIASVFDFSSIEFWQKHQLQIYKIASAELIDLPLLKAVAATHQPIILSTGMASLDEIDEAVATLQRANSSIDLTLLKCSSAYPAPVESMNLAGIQTLRSRYDLTVGLSDHSMEHAIAVAAVGLGATVFEKHLKLPDGPPSPDDAFSLTPEEFREWTCLIRTALKALGSGELKPSESERSTLPFRRSLFVVQDMQPGEAFTPQNLRSIRPANGMHPRHYETVLGKVAACAIRAGTPLSAELIESASTHSELTR